MKAIGAIILLALAGPALAQAGHERTTRFVIDLTTSKAVPEVEFAKP